MPNSQLPERHRFSEYNWNRAEFPMEELRRYAGKHVAFSLDGKRILASGDTFEQMEQNLIAQGIAPNWVVSSFIDPY